MNTTNKHRSTLCCLILAGLCCFSARGQVRSISQMPSTNVVKATDEILLNVDLGSSFTTCRANWNTVSNHLIGPTMGESWLMRMSANGTNSFVATVDGWSVFDTLLEQTAWATASNAVTMNHPFCAELWLNDGADPAWQIASTNGDGSSDLVFRTALDAAPVLSLSQSGVLSANGAGVTNLPRAFPGSMVIAGDSMSAWTVGTNWGWASFFTNSMARLGFSNVVNVAVSGRTSSNVWVNYATEIAPYAPNSNGTPALLSVFCGINDVTSGFAPDVTVSYLSNIWTTATADGFQVVGWILYPTWALNRSALSNLSCINGKLYSLSTNITFLMDTAMLLWNGGDTNLLYDGYHTTAAGASLLNAQFQWLLEHGNSARGMNAAEGWIRANNGQAPNLYIGGLSGGTSFDGTNILFADNAGFTHPFNNAVQVQISGAGKVLYSSSGVDYVPTYALSWTTTGLGGLSDVSLLRDAAGVLAQQSGTKAQTNRIYGGKFGSTNSYGIEIGLDRPNGTYFIRPFTTVTGGSATNFPLALGSHVNVQSNLTAGGYFFPTNALADWPTAPRTHGEAYIGNSNGTLYVLKSVPGSLTWATTNAWP